MDRLKAFLVGTLKIAFALFLAGMAIGAAILGWEAYSSSKQKALEEPLAQLKTWPPYKVGAFANVQFMLKTIWRDGRLHYQFLVDGYPKAIELARDRKDESAQFTVEFYDANGFKILSHDVSLKSMAAKVDANGQRKALDANSSASMSAEDYRNAARWGIAWNFPTAVESAQPKPEAVPPTPRSAPKPSAAPAKWRDISLWRQLNRQMSKAQVEQLLGPPTKINEAGVITFWYYGYPLGGWVDFNSSGSVSGWKEP